MKHIKIFTIIGVLAVFFSACKKDDDFSMVGKWNVDKVTSTTSFLGETETETEYNAGTMEFKSDGTGMDQDGESFTWKLSGNTLTMTVNDEELGPISLDFALTTKTNDKVVAEANESMFGISISIVTELSRL